MSMIKLRRSYKPVSVLVLLLLFSATIISAPGVSALGSSQNPQAGSVGLEGTVASPPPTKGATIATPANGQTISSIPITVSGLCPASLLIKVFSNNIFVGAAQCNNGSYSMQVSLFSGRNDLIARVYDALDQAGPDSNTVTVNFNDGQFAQFGTRVSLTSKYAKLGADPGQELDWPIVLSGGVGPYAISVDWGDGKPATLMSVQFPGDLTIKHVYDSAGIYNVIIKATDKNGTVAFLQLVGIANGKVSQSTQASKANTGVTGTTTTPASGTPIIIMGGIMLPLIAATFWLGRRHELYSLRKRLENTRNQA